MEAVLYHKVDDHTVQCRLCGHGCNLKNGQRGICAVRENVDGQLQSLVFGKIIARNIDPIEKKPLYHFHPGSLAYSIATVGCNFRCSFCQNADIAQLPKDRKGLIMGDIADPETIVADAVRHHCASIAYTYTEPTVYFEFALETAKAAKAHDVANVFVTNGYMSREAVEMIAPFLDAANVDLKAFSDNFYHKYCGARLKPVLDTLIAMKELGIWVEVTTLMIPGLNDDPQELTQLAGFIHRKLGSETPWHISRFHPTYRLTDRPATALDTMLQARDIGRAAGLHYIYLGNVPGEESGAHTHCPQCGARLIERRGYHIASNRIIEDQCPDCHAAIAGRRLAR